MKAASRAVSFLLGTFMLAAPAFVTSAGSHWRPIPNGKVLVDDFPIEAKRRLFAKAGITNFSFCGYGQRDSKGDRLCFPVETQDQSGQRADYLVVVTAQGVHLKPWHIFNEMMTDNEELAVWEDRAGPTTSTDGLGKGDQLAKGSSPRSVSAGWIAVGASDRAPWMARLETPSVAAAERPQPSHKVELFADGETVHVFAR